MEINSASIDNIVHVGSPRHSFHCEEWTSTKIIIHEFAKLPRNDTIISPEFKCLDHQWSLVIPTLRGNYIPIHLVSASKKSINIEYMFTVRDKNDEQVYKSIRKVYCFNSLNPMDCETTNGMGESFNRMGYVQALGYMKEYGGLVIEVHMKQTEEILPPFTPENPMKKMIQDKFLDEESSDILFEVGEAKEIGTTKILVVRNLFLKGNPRWGRQEPAAKKLMNLPFTSATLSTISSASFPAHRLILQLSSTTLAELCESVTDKTSPIQISGVSPATFYTLLYYIYGGKITDILEDEYLEANARELIDVADRFGVINLKLEAEAHYVESITITTDNVVELLLYADSKNCALLKEATIDFMAENAVKVLEKVSLKDVPGGLYADLLAAMVRIGGEDKRIADSRTFNSSIVMNELIAMRISELRRRAHEEGLDYDGSREVLIDALKSVYELDMEMMDD